MSWVLNFLKGLTGGGGVPLLMFSKVILAKVVVDFKRGSLEVVWIREFSMGVFRGEINKGFSKGGTLMGVSKGRT